MKDVTILLMIATVLSITLGTVANGFVFASTEEGNSEGSGSEEEEQSEEDETEEPEPEPEINEPEPARPQVCPPLCGPEPEPGDDNNKPLPYCDTPEGEAASSCHDRDDYDEDTLLYPCNDGTQAPTPEECPDATKNITQPLPPQQMVSPSPSNSTQPGELTPLECLELLLKDSNHPCALEYPNTPGSPLECLRQLLIDPTDPCKEDLETLPEEPLPPCYPSDPVPAAAEYKPICQAPVDKPGENYQPKLPNDNDLDYGNSGVPENVKVIGEDVYNLDRDRDGIGCEPDEWGGNGRGGGGGTGSGGAQNSGSGPINMIPKPGQAIVKILYEDEWSGSVSDGNFDSASYDGTGDSSIAFDCASSDIYSLTIQKGEDDNDVMTLIIEDYSKQVLDQGQTSAEFGIVSLSGTC